MNLMNEQILGAIKLISDEKKIPRDTVVDALKIAVTKAYEREYPEEVLSINIDIDKNIFNVNKILNVVEDSEELNDYCEISVKDADKFYQKNKIDKKAKIGDVIEVEVNLSKLPKQIVDHIMQIFKQGITIKANVEIYNKWKDSIGKAIFAEVEKNDKHGIYVNLENGEYGFMSLKDAIPNEKLIPGQKYDFYIKDVKQQSAGWPIILSRADEGLVKQLLKANIPEIQEGIIEIIDLARVPGFKTKVAVISHQPGIEPCGTIIGSRGIRIQPIVSSLNNEKIEVIEHSDNFEKYIIDVCSPAPIRGYKVVKEADEKSQKQLIIIVDGEYLPLLLGKKGSNIRIISKLLKADVDVITLADAKEDDLEYIPLEVRSVRQRAFDRILERNRSSNDAYSLNNFNKPSFKPVNNQTVNENKPNNQKVNKSQSIDSTLSLLNKIDSFNTDSAENQQQEASSVEESTPTKASSTNDLFENLKANGQQSNSLELEINAQAKAKNSKIKKPKRSHKPKAPKQETPKTSIMEQFSDLDKEALLNELSQENESREDDFDDNDDNFDNFDENK